jgi:hypothetical protein
MPKQGTKAPWYLRQNYLLDLLTTRFAPVDNPALAFSRKGERRPPPPPVAGLTAR